VTVFVTQFFVFYHAQMAGVVWLGLNVVALGVLDYLIAREEKAPAVLAARRQAQASTATDSA
jgi:hypothetical protein